MLGERMVVQYIRVGWYVEMTEESNSVAGYEGLVAW